MNEAEEAPNTNIMVFVGGSKTSFHCEDCGANVFTKLDGDRYQCNGCPTIWQGTRKS